MNQNRFYWTAAGAIGVIAGVVLKNSNEQREEKDERMDKLGAAAFVAGWSAVAYSMCLNNDGTPGNWDTGCWLPAAAIVATVFMMKQKMKADEPIPRSLPMAFVAAWVYIGHYVATKRNLAGYARTAAYAVPAMVVASMLFALPEQRKACIVDGPGAYLFNTAWATLAITNAM